MKQKPLLLIDCQVFQTPAWDRGMGKYSLSLLTEMYEQGEISKHTTRFIFNSRLGQNSDVLEAIESSCPGIEIITIDLHVPRDHKIMRQKTRNEHVLTEYVEKNYPGRAVEFLILSLFLDQACPAFPANVKKMLIFYDLIPLMYFRRYLGTGPAENYLGHLKTLFEADIYFTISETVANDLSAFLGIDPKRVVNINGASINRSDLLSEKPPTLSEDKPFILMPSGGELRKNNLLAAQAFALFNEKNGGAYRLVLTSSFGQGTINHLEEISPDLEFTGNITEAQLQWLYENCAAVLFASEYEGLGLPILEAVEVGKMVACSNIPVFREISTEAFLFFDHLDPTDIARKLERAIRTKPNKAIYRAIEDEYSWPSCVKLFLEGRRCVLGRSTKQTKRIAVVSPSIGSPSKAARTVALMHDELSGYGTVDYYTDRGDDVTVRPNHLQYVAQFKDARVFDASLYATYDVVIYHICDDNYSGLVLKAALCYPGKVMLYDQAAEVVYGKLYEAGYISEERREIGVRDGLEGIETRNIVVLRAQSMRRKAANTFHFPTRRLPYSIPKQVESGVSHLAVLTEIIDAQSLDWVSDLLDILIENGVTPRILSLRASREEFVEYLREAYGVSVFHDLSEYDLELQLGSLNKVLLVGIPDRYKSEEIRVHAAKYSVASIELRSVENIYKDSSDVIRFIKMADSKNDIDNLLNSADVTSLVGALMSGESPIGSGTKIHDAIVASSSAAQIINRIRGEAEDEK